MMDPNSLKLAWMSRLENIAALGVVMTVVQVYSSGVPGNMQSNLFQNPNFVKNKKGHPHYVGL